MNAETWRALDRLFKKSPILRAATAPSREEVLKSLEQLGRPAHEDYVEFVERYGGATVGPLPIFGLRVSETMGKPWHVVEVNEGYRAQRWPGVDDWLVGGVNKPSSAVPTESGPTVAAASQPVPGHMRTDMAALGMAARMKPDVALSIVDQTWPSVLEPVQAPPWQVLPI